MRPRVMMLALLLALVPGCLREVFHRDGAGCDPEGNCPPGQVCSALGVCLFPCPVTACTGEQCGCSDVTYYDSQWPRTCLGDGLCHRACTPATSDCYEGTRCALDLGVCAKECGNGPDFYCPVGTTCQGEDPGGTCRGDATEL